METFNATLTDVRLNYGAVIISVLFDNGSTQIRRDYTLTLAEEATEEAIAAKVSAECENLNALYQNGLLLMGRIGEAI